LGSGSVLRNHQSGSDSCSFSNKGVFRKQLVDFWIAESEILILLRIDGSGRLPNSPIQNIYGFSNLECKKINADFPFCKITELHCPEEERVVCVLCVF